jgi:YidC/Oxa1 family membrane protein insertase
MIGQIWTTMLTQPLLNGLLAIYQLVGNLGVSIIILTTALRFILLPLSAPSLKNAAKMKEVAPKLDKLKKKYKNDKQGLAKAQMDLYKQEGINPASGCLPQILQLIILAALYNVFRQVLGSTEGLSENVTQLLYPFINLQQDQAINLKFAYLDLTQPDTFKLGNIPIPGFFLLAAAGIQFLSSKLLMPAVKTEEKISKKTESKSDDFASIMQTQSLYLFPLMTIFIGFRFPSGLVLYWLTFSLVNLIQQLVISKKKNAA